MPQAGGVVLIRLERFHRVRFQKPAAQQKCSDQQPQIPIQPDIVPPVDDEFAEVREVVTGGFGGGLKHGRGLAEGIAGFR